MDILIRVLEFLCSISLLVIIHEFGHFTFARLFGVRVEKYYVFFNPWYSLMRWKKFDGKWHFKFFTKNEPEVKEEERASLPDDDWRKHPETTEWGLGWLPLGGYCAIAGMVDETHNADQLSVEVHPWEFRAQKGWKRLLIIVGGVLFNFLAAGLIYAGILFFCGEEYVSPRNATMGEQYCATMLKQGFQQGDQLLTINGDTVETLNDAVQALLLDDDVHVGVLRDGKSVDILLPEDFAQQFMESGEKGLLHYRTPCVVSDVMPDGVGAKAGLQRGDSIVMIDSVPVLAFQDLEPLLNARSGDSISIQLYRAGKPLSLTAKLGDEAKLGIVTDANPERYFQKEVKKYGFFRSIPAGFVAMVDETVSYVRQFKLVFTKAGAKQLGGFGTMGSLFPPHWDWLQFWYLSAFISVALGFMNILPIPALDGGYVMFILFEMVTGKKPSEKWMERLTNAGFALLLALIIYANLNDIIRFFFR